MQLIVNVKKLNKRSFVPSSLAENNIIGTVFQGFRFDGEEITDIPNPSMGKWYRDRDGSCYWGGGIIVEQPPIINKILGLPINLPENYRIGIDISHYNQNINWADVKNSGISFVYIKTSEGVGTPDSKAKEHASNAKLNGLRIGYYHFCRPDKRNGGTVISDSTAEAEEVIRIISVIEKPDLPIVLDLEDQQNWDSPLGKDDYLLWITTFITKIAETSDFKCMIYSRRDYLSNKLPQNHELGKYKLWISSYPQNPDADHVTCPDGWIDWAMWQYTESGVVGSNAKFDINILKDSSLF